MSSRRIGRRQELPRGPLRPEKEPGGAFGSTTRNRDLRKTLQLCEQASDAISVALAECGDPLLHDLVVEAVRPAPSASRLRVVVSAPVGAGAHAVLAALEKVRGWLRHEVATQISRKRTPELCFELSPPRGQP